MLVQAGPAKYLSHLHLSEDFFFAFDCSVGLELAGHWTLFLRAVESQSRVMWYSVWPTHPTVAKLSERYPVIWMLLFIYIIIIITCSHRLQKIY